jgi:hypothetical protein
MTFGLSYLANLDGRNGPPASVLTKATATRSGPIPRPSRHDEA